jgi:AcrR family transcriptional regulator
VGIERIIKEGEVTLATFYRHFPRKVRLVVAYLHGAHDHIAACATEQAEMLQGRDLVRAVGDDVTSRILHAAFRGCAFLNAVSEFEDPQSPVRLLVAEHRQWCYQFLRQAFEGRRAPTSRQRRPSLRDAARRRDERRVPRHAHHRHPYVRPRR